VYWVSFPDVKWLGHGVDHPFPSSAKSKERVELYLYSPWGLHGLLGEKKVKQSRYRPGVAKRVPES